jgi:hypothetical protein
LIGLKRSRGTDFQMVRTPAIPITSAHHNQTGDVSNRMLAAAWLTADNAE